MGHNHSHHNHSHNSEKNIGIAFLLNFSFVIIELIGGFYTNSMAILSDALHDFGDSVALGLSYFFEKKSKKAGNKKYTYGFKRLSLISALINSTILLIGSTFIMIKVIPRLINPQAVEVNGMLWLAVIGVFINGLAVLKLNKGGKIAERAVALHLMEDALGWIAVLIGAFVIKLTGWTIIDPLLSIGISIYVIKNVYHNLKDIWTVILQATPNEIDIDKLNETLRKKFTDIEDIHNIHIWTLDGESHVMTFHMVVSKDCNVLDIVELKKRIKHHLEHEGIGEVSIDIENLGNCSNDYEHHH